jgi:hypothetical protein
MGECGVRGGYAEIVNMDPGVMAMLQKSISAKLCPPVLGQVDLQIERNLFELGGPRPHILFPSLPHFVCKFSCHGGNQSF